MFHDAVMPRPLVLSLGIGTSPRAPAWGRSIRTTWQECHPSWIIGLCPCGLSALYDIYDLLFVISPYFCNLFSDESYGKAPEPHTKLLHDDSWKPKNAAASTQPSESQRPKNTQKYHIAELWTCFDPECFTYHTHSPSNERVLCISSHSMNSAWSWCLAMQCANCENSLLDVLVPKPIRVF